MLETQRVHNFYDDFVSRWVPIEASISSEKDCFYKISVNSANQFSDNVLISFFDTCKLEAV